MKKVNIRCSNPDCNYHQTGFLYELENGKLTNDKNSKKAYDMIIKCPEGHKNKIWIIPDDPKKFLSMDIGFQKPWFF